MALVFLLVVCGVSQNYFIFKPFTHVNSNSGVSACPAFIDFQAILLLYSSNHWLKEILCLAETKSCTMNFVLREFLSFGRVIDLPFLP
jgi:16S rRNA C1402 (ribose-2'-O) methylase RsmI